MEGGEQIISESVNRKESRKKEEESKGKARVYH